MKRRFIIVILVIIIGVLIYILYPKKKINYTTGRVETIEIDVATKYAGRVIKIYKDEGDFVKKGELLLEIDKRELEALKQETEKRLKSLYFEKKSLEAQIKNLKEDVKRTKKLEEEGAVPEREYERMKTKLFSLQYKLKALEENIESLKKTIERLNIQEEETEIKSPVTGVVLEKNIEIGELTRPGVPLFTIANLDTLYVYAFLPQKEIYDLKTGKIVRVVPHTGKKVELRGEVVWISDRAEFTPKNIITPDEKALLVFKFKVKVINRDNLLKPGMTVSVYYK